MITKYNDYIKENVDSYFLQTYEETKAWLDSMKIINYTINNDLTVDVDGEVDISHKNLTKIPVQFNEVKGSFYCHGNLLTSLKGSPKTANDFHCQYNQLTSLKYSPTTVNNFYCYKNKLTSLTGAPTTVNDFYCDDNPLKDITTNLDSKILIKSIKDNRNWTEEISTEVYDNYFEHWISKDINIVSVLKDKVSDKIKEKYKHLFNANKFDLL